MLPVMGHTFSLRGKPPLQLGSRKRLLHKLLILQSDKAIDVMHAAPVSVMGDLSARYQMDVQRLHCILFRFAFQSVC